MIADLGDVRLYYEDEGSGEPVVLIAGVGSNHKFWKRMLPYLEGYRLITMDNRGIGETEYEGEISIQAMADDVVHLMAHLGIAKAHIVGWSMGSLISQSIALRFPEMVQTLTLVSSYQFRPARSAYFMKLLSKMYMDGQSVSDAMYVAFNAFCFTETKFTELENAGKVMSVSKAPEQIDGVYKQICAMDGFDSTETSCNIRAPTLVVHGGEDIMVEPIKGRAMAASIKGSKYVEIPVMGHTIPADAYAADVLELIKANPMD